VIVRARFREVQEQVEAAAVPSAEARLLALAYSVEAAVEDGCYRSAAEVATVLGLSRSRLSQVMRRRWAAVREQEAALRGCWTRPSTL
jgi:predicted XRE-type DNA-binding protein